MSSDSESTSSASSDADPGLVTRMRWNEMVTEGIAKCRNNGREDFTIVCPEKTWKVHQFVLSLASPVLREMCASPYKEYHLPFGEEPQCIDAMIEYVYTGTYDYHNDAELHYKMIILAQKYELQILLEAAAEAYQLALPDLDMETSA